jgi:hypothetical protein
MVRRPVHDERWRQKIEDDMAVLTSEENGGRQGWTSGLGAPYIGAHTWGKTGYRGSPAHGRGGKHCGERPEARSHCRRGARGWRARAVSGWVPCWLGGGFVQRRLVHERSEGTMGLANGAV